MQVKVSKSIYNIPYKLSTAQNQVSWIERGFVNYIMNNKWRGGGNCAQLTETQIYLAKLHINNDYFIE